MQASDRTTAATLGPLEAQVLDRLWSEARLVTVRDVHTSFPELAYTTLMTTLDRLFRKGVLLRVRKGRAFAYEPRCTRSELFGELVSGQVAELLRSQGESTAILSTLVSVIGSRDAALLDELETLVRAERARLSEDAP